MIKHILVDLYNGSYNNKHYGHEMFNEQLNKLDGRYYAYVPNIDNPNIDKFGVKRTDMYVDDILVIFVKRIDEDSNDRIIIGFYPKARIYRTRKDGSSLGRTFIDKEGKEKIATYSIESDHYIKVEPWDSLIIKTNEYSPWMFRKQRVYSGKYPILDSQILNFVNLLSLSKDTNK